MLNFYKNMKTFPSNHVNHVVRNKLLAIKGILMLQQKQCQECSRLLQEKIREMFKDLEGSKDVESDNKTNNKG